MGGIIGFSGLWGKLRNVIALVGLIFFCKNVNIKEREDIKKIYHFKNPQDLNN